MKQKSAPAYNASTRVEVDSDQPLVDAERILRDFTRRAFRRAVTDADVEPFVTVVKDKLAADYSFELAMRAALKGVLMSPEFLFLHETPGKLDDFALASRLSYFLWSSPPDDELLKLAEPTASWERPTNSAARSSGCSTIRRPRTSRRISSANGSVCARSTSPSRATCLYPEFDHLLKVSMIREAELFFDEVLKHDLSVTNFVASDFSMLNGRLAKHYGIPGVDGWEFQKVKLPPESHRGGVLTMAAVLKVTANGTTTSPVVRGNWVLDRLLGTPPPRRRRTTFRRSIPTSAARRRFANSWPSTAPMPRAPDAMRKIDPPGFALESFDCIGGWRDNYRVTGNGKAVVIDGRRMQYHEGKAVDPSDVMEDGRPFKNVDEFKQLLLTDKDRLARALAAKLIDLRHRRRTDARRPGRPRRDGRESSSTRITACVRLIHEVVQSDLFRNK